MTRALPAYDAPYLQALPLANLALMAARMQDYIAAFAAFPIGKACTSSARILRAMTHLMAVMKIARQHNHEIVMRAHLKHDPHFRADVFRSLGGERAAQAWERNHHKVRNAAEFKPLDFRNTDRPLQDKVTLRKTVKTDESGWFRWAVINRPHQHASTSRHYPSSRASPDMESITLIELRPDQLRPDQFHPDISEALSPRPMYRQTSSTDPLNQTVISRKVLSPD